MAGVLLLLIYLQMADNQENAVATLLIEPPEELNDNITTDQFSEDNETSKNNDDEVAEKISNGAERSHLVETGSPFWDVIPISNPGVSSENWHTIMVQNHYKFDSTITPLSPREWHLLRNKKSIRVQFPYEMTAVKDILERKKRGKFSIQLISIEHEQFSHAVSLLKRLIHDGYYAYLQRTETKFEEKYWYRVRAGFFKNLEDARMTGKEIIEKYQEERLFPSQFEIRGDDGETVVQYYPDGAPQEEQRKNAVKKVEIPKQKTKKKAASSKKGPVQNEKGATQNSIEAEKSVVGEASEIFQKIRQDQGESDMKSGWARRRASIELDTGQEFWADASNIALATGVKNEIRIEDLLSFIEFMKSIGFENLYFIADASLRYYFVDEDRDEYDKLVSSGSRFVQAPKGVEADTLLLQYALEETAIVITNDGFKAHEGDYPEQHEWFSNHQVQFTYIKEKWKLSPQLIPSQKNEVDKG